MPVYLDGKAKHQQSPLSGKHECFYLLAAAPAFNRTSGLLLRSVSAAGIALIWGRRCGVSFGRKQAAARLPVVLRCDSGLPARVLVVLLVFRSVERLSFPPVFVPSVAKSGEFLKLEPWRYGFFRTYLSGLFFDAGSVCRDLAGWPTRRSYSGSKMLWLFVWIFPGSESYLAGPICGSTKPTS